jgi:all-trans-retinol 13,14-reductase
MGEGFDAIVIGSGIGGISAAAVLARKGIRPLVLEQHFAPGGNAQTFRRHKQFDFDVGLHYIGDCGPGGLFDSLLGQMGIAGQVEFLPMDQDGFDTLRFPDMEFRVPAGWERYHQRLRETFPDEARAVDRYIEHLRAVATASAEETAVDRLLRKPRDQTTLGEVFDTLEIGYRLRNVLGAEGGLYGAPPSRAALGVHAGVMHHYMQGAYFVKGGSRALIDPILDAMEAGGGEVRLRSRVRRIIIEEGKAVGVELATGEEIRAPLVISNADAKRTFLEMVGEEHLSPQLRDQVKEYRMALPLFIVYMAMEVDPSELGIPITNFFLMPSDDIEEGYAACYDGKVPEKPWVYISTASVKDPESRNLAPARLLGHLRGPGRRRPLPPHARLRRRQGGAREAGHRRHERDDARLPAEDRLAGMRYTADPGALHSLHRRHLLRTGAHARPVRPRPRRAPVGDPQPVDGGSERRVRPRHRRGDGERLCRRRHDRVDAARHLRSPVVAARKARRSRGRAPAPTVGGRRGPPGPPAAST